MKKTNIYPIDTESGQILQRQVVEFFCNGVLEFAKEVFDEAKKEKATLLFVDLGGRPLSFPFLLFFSNNYKLNFFYGSSRTLGLDFKAWVEWERINSSIPPNKKLILVDDVAQTGRTLRLLRHLAENKKSKIISASIYNQSNIGQKHPSVQEIKISNVRYKVNLLGLNFIRGFDYFYVPGKGSYVRRKNIDSFKAKREFNICTLYKVKKQINHLAINYLKYIDWNSKLLENIWPIELSEVSKKHIIYNLYSKFPISPLDFREMKLYYTNNIWQKFSEDIKKAIKEHI